MARHGHGRRCERTPCEVRREAGKEENCSASLLTPCTRPFIRDLTWPTQPERSNRVCGTTAEALALPLHPPPEGPVVIRTHGLDAHGVTLEPLERLTQLRAPWTFADARVSRREVPPEAIYAGVGVANPHRRRGRLFSRA